MITLAYTNRYRTNEFVQFSADTLFICKQNSPEELKIQDQLKAFQQAFNSLEASFKKGRKKPFTEELAELNERRDTALKCLTGIIRVSLNHFNPEKKEAAEKLSACFKKYGNSIYSLNYQAETSVLTKLGADLQNGLLSSLNTLGLKDLADEMQEANTLFMETFLERNEVEVETGSVKTSDLAKNTTDKFKLLTQIIEAHAMISPGKAYKELIDQLNNLIEHYNNLVTQRNQTNPEEEDETV